MRKPIIAGNWKMNVLPGQAVELVRRLWADISGYDAVEVVVCPPCVDLPAVSEFMRSGDIRIGLGAQNMHWKESGAFTGEVSPTMLLDLGATHVIIGHSERRQLFGETDQGVNRKVKSALSFGLVPIMCVGETLKQREAGETEGIITGQVNCGLFELGPEEVPTVVVAYEPIWAIGTGKAATAGDAQEVTGMIRSVLSGQFGQQAAESVRIQYGGSVKPDNVSEIMSMPDIDGALVGGASLEADVFARIVKFS
ncbi:MAG: triose-phosphate isomerase [Actinobacteria bacterium]|nr:triose-phosphate isomerase [Actinomycetota bacterium]MCG2819148.1 triose-phosphate isomerase [Actinomycetes bacterium]MBU4219017.1 triose-phosphate isomerase [Actinomycetota bacterium]MBU4359205.1 triose-phosphate isomerase [Actinomycetota bacterium]MBU4391520.1 triose-phosphate isomerase [Actinomycetota bacterium]